MNFQKVVFFSILCFIVSCSSWKNELNQIGDNDSAIQNSITDFMKTENLYKKNKVFSISLIDTDKEKLLISILPDQNKFFPTEKDLIGSKSGYLPTSFFEVSGKLFYWDDSTKILSQPAMDALNKFNLIDTTKFDRLTIVPEYIVDESQKAVDYYICKNDYTKYKKVKTKIAYGYYKAPKLNCD